MRQKKIYGKEIDEIFSELGVGNIGRMMKKKNFELKKNKIERI